MITTIDKEKYFLKTSTYFPPKKINKNKNNKQKLSEN